MKLITILKVKNEDDIIEDCLKERLSRFDLISIIDSSLDHTPNICRQIAVLNPGKILYQWDDTPLSIKYYRMKLYDSLRDKIDDDTWIWQLDTDIRLNINIEEMINLLAMADEEGANCIICRFAQFYPTFEDIKNNTHWKDFQYYSLNWRSKLIYKGISSLYFKGDFQETPTIPNEKKALFSPVVRHYQYRTPEQIQKRIDRAFGLGGYSHIISKDWHDYIIDREFLSKWGDNSHRRYHHSWRSLVQLTKEKHKK